MKPWRLAAQIVLALLTPVALWLLDATTWGPFISAAYGLWLLTSGG